MSSLEKRPTLGATDRMKSATMWREVESKITADLAKGDIEQVAHSLACSWWGASDDMGYSEDAYMFDKDKARAICTDHRLVPYHEQLWRMIVAENEYDGTPWDFKDEAYKTFTEEYGWDI